MKVKVGQIQPLTLFLKSTATRLLIYIFFPLLLRLLCFLLQESTKAHLGFIKEKVLKANNWRISIIWMWASVPSRNLIHMVIHWIPWNSIMILTFTRYKILVLVCAPLTSATAGWKRGKRRKQKMSFQLASCLRAAFVSFIARKL